MDRRSLSPRSPVAPLYVRRPRTLDHLRIGHERSDRAAHHVDQEVLELAGSYPALVLPDGVTQRRTLVERDGHLGFDSRHVFDRSRTLSGHRTVPAQQRWKVLALSRAVLLAPYSRADVRNLHARLRGQRTGFDEPMGLPRRPGRRWRDGPA